jgi:hypothetical protein
MKTGLYRISGISLIPIYLVVIEDLEIDFEKEIKILKEFSTKQDRKRFLENIIERYKNGEKEIEELIKYSLILYQNETKNLIIKEGIEMNVMERNLNKWIEESGLKEKYIQMGLEKGIEKSKIEIAKNLLDMKMPIEQISKITNYHPVILKN